MSTQGPVLIDYLCLLFCVGRMPCVPCQNTLGLSPSYQKSVEGGFGFPEGNSGKGS